MNAEVTANTSLGWTACNQSFDWGNFEMYLRAVRFKYELDAVQ